ncbi:hypothetical protein ACOME3_000399 [Neoechinorhynchus agilis]
MRAFADNIEGVRHANIFPTSRGGMKFLLPINPIHYNILVSLQSVLHHGIPNYCGLRKKTGRNCTFPSTNIFENLVHTIIDMDLLASFFDLSIAERASAARKTCSRIEDLFDILIGILDAAFVF